MESQNGAIVLLVAIAGFYMFLELKPWQSWGKKRRRKTSFNSGLSVYKPRARRRRRRGLFHILVLFLILALCYPGEVAIALTLGF